MKIRHLALSMALTLSTLTSSWAHENTMFGYTHLLPSPYTLQAGRLVFGTEIAYGVTDFLQVGTSLIRDIYKIFNVNAKLGVLDYEQFALGLTLGYQTFNYHDLVSTNPDLTVKSWLPGVVTAYGLADTLALFIGGNLNFTETVLNQSGLKYTGLTEGASVESDLSWAYNPHKSSIGQVLSAGVSYDINYKLIGFGVSHHWPGFTVGFHYTPNADANKVQPIISGGASVDL